MRMLSLRTQPVCPIQSCVAIVRHLALAPCFRIPTGFCTVDPRVICGQNFVYIVNTSGQNY